VSVPDSPPAIVPIVEGQSEERSVAGLVRRLLTERSLHGVVVARPFRVKRSKIVRPGELERAILQASRARSGAAAIIVLLDADDDCPAQLGGELLARATANSHLPVAVVLASREFEAWFLASKESLRGVRGIRADATAPREPEAIRDAKGRVSENMEDGRGYIPVDDQPALVAKMDFEAAIRGSRSFARFVREIDRLARPLVT
jgi:hypothetical protein